MGRPHPPPVAGMPSTSRRSANIPCSLTRRHSISPPSPPRCPLSAEPRNWNSLRASSESSSSSSSSSSTSGSSGGGGSFPRCFLCCRGVSPSPGGVSSSSSSLSSSSHGRRNGGGSFASFPAFLWICSSMRRTSSDSPGPGGFWGAGGLGGPRASSARTRRDRMSSTVSLQPTSSRYCLSSPRPSFHAAAPPSNAATSAGPLGAISTTSTFLSTGGGSVPNFSLWYFDLSCFRANSNILMRRTRSVFRFS